MIYKPIYFNDFGKEVSTDSQENKCYYIAAYNDNGDYVGNRKDGRFFEKRGIKPELRTPTSKVCSIGFCEQEQKWYGWSHRAIFGFGIGSKVKKGDCAYRPNSVDKLYNSMMKCSNGVSIEKIKDGIRIKHENVELTFDENDIAIDSKPSEPTYQIIKCGKGEWTAKTLEDAKQMACDFAEGVN